MAEILKSVSNTTVTTETQQIAVRVPENGGLLAYLMNPGITLDLSAIDFHHSALAMEDGNLRITLPDEAGEILLLDMDAAADSGEPVTILLSDGSSITSTAMMNALAAAEQTVQDVEPAAGPESTISQVQPGTANGNGFTVPGDVGGGFGDDSSVISDVIGPFTIAPAFDEIDTEEVNENDAVADSPAPQNPDAINDAATTPHDTAVVIDVLTNDIDPDGDPLTITGTTNPNNGTITVNPNGTITYTPNNGYVGTDTFTYTITDGNNTDTATVTVTVTNDAPDAINDTTTTPYLTPVTISVLGNDTDPNGDPLSVTGTTNPSNGTVVVNANGTITYTPNSGFSGTDTFTYTISDGLGGTDTATVTVTVENAGPDAIDDSATTPHDTPVTITVLGNDTDDNGDTLSITGTTNPSNGTIVVNANGTITYTPNSGYVGTDTFTYTITDGNGGYDTATVTVTTTNTAPDAVNDSVTTDYLTPVTISVLGNDTDPENDTLSVTGTTNPSNGTIVVNANGTITYTPNNGFSGTDTFTYTITDGNGGYDTATVTVTVENAGPDAIDDSTTTPHNTPVVISVLNNDTDDNGDTLSITGTTNPSNGSIVVNANGTITYTPNNGYVGTDTFTYTITDGTDTDTATVTVTVTNTAPDANNDSTTTAHDTPVTISVLGNDTDPEGDTLSVTGTTNPSNGSIVVNANGTITYTPNNGYIGTDTFTYTITDGHGGFDTATVTVYVTNTAPDANNDSETTNYQTPVTINVLGNDTDPEGDTLSVTGTTNPAHGSINVNANGTITYTPDNGYSGTDTFTYTISDGNGGFDTATVTVTVGNPPNTAPDARNDSATTHAGDPVTVNVLNNDTDPDGDTLSVTGTTNPAHGSIHVNNNGTITYTPNNGYTGQDSFTYTISDGNGGFDTATVTINVTNRAPNAVNDNSSGRAGSWVTVNVLGNDSDPDGDNFNLTSFDASSVTSTNYGGMMGTVGGSVQYVGNGIFRVYSNVVGTQSFTYTITDEHGATDTATVRVNFTPSNNNEGWSQGPDNNSSESDTDCPLVLDLDGDGLTLISLEESEAYFDLDGDGSAEHTGWAGSTEGILAIDRDGNGTIDGIDEVFGNSSMEGFTELAWLEDTNNDGLVDANDDRFSELLIWIDADSDGFSDDGELFTLADLGIVAINTGSTYIDETNNGQWVSNEGSFVYEDGSTGTAYSVWYENEDVDTQETAEADSADTVGTNDVLVTVDDTSNVITSVDDGVSLTDTSSVDALTGLGLDVDQNPDTV